MTTYLFWIICGLAVLLLVARMPGMQLLLLPAVWVVAESGKGIIGFVLYWLLYTLKIIIRAHKELFAHFTSDEEEYDIEIAMSRKERE